MSKGLRLVVVATVEELPLVKELRFDRNAILITGVGATNVIKALSTIPKNTEIINIGYVGSNKLPIGDVVKVSETTLYHENVDYRTTNYILRGGDDKDIVCYTSTDFVTHTNITEPCVFDMELTFIKSLGFENVRSIKKVSDNLCIDEYEETIKTEAKDVKN